MDAQIVIAIALTAMSLFATVALVVKKKHLIK